MAENGVEPKLTQYLRDGLDKVALSEGFKNYELKVNLGSSVGDGFIGLIYRARIQEVDADKKLDLVLKMPPFNKARRNDFGAMELFEREVYVYNEILPEFVKFQQEKKIKESEGYFSFPKCYYADYSEEKDDAVIIMEDLRANDFDLWDKHKTVDLDHAKLLVTALGRFNAVSFALKAQKPKLFEKFKKLKEFLTDKFTEGELGQFFVNGLQQAAETIDESDTESRSKVLALAKNFKDEMKIMMNSDLPEPYTVVVHGDCWSNNYMYQYKNGSVQKIVMLDWQASRCSSPVSDLAYFIFSCTDEELRAKHYKELLQIYHQSLKKLLDRLGGDTKSQFPFSAMLQQFEQFGRIGVVMASLTVPMSAKKSEDLAERDLMAEGDGDDDPEKLKEILSSMSGMEKDSTKLRLRSVIMDTIKYGYL